MTSQPVLRLTDRLRGRYVLAVDDGLGPLDGSDTFERCYAVSPLHEEAAAAIDRLTAGDDLDTDDLVLRLSEPRDPFGIGKAYVLPIFIEAIREIATLQETRGAK